MGKTCNKFENKLILTICNLSYLLIIAYILSCLHMIYYFDYYMYFVYVCLLYRYVAGADPGFWCGRGTGRGSSGMELPSAGSGAESR